MAEASPPSTTATDTASADELARANEDLQDQLDAIHVNRQGMKSKLLSLMAQRRSVWEEEFEQDERVWEVERSQQLEAAALRRIEQRRLQAKRLELEHAVERRELELHAIETLKRRQLEAILMNSSDAAAAARADDGWLFEDDHPEDDGDASSDDGRDAERGEGAGAADALPSVEELVAVQSQAAKQLRHFKGRCAREQQRAEQAVALSADREAHTRQIAEIARLKQVAQRRRERGLEYLVELERKGGDDEDDSPASALALALASAAAKKQGGGSSEMAEEEEDAIDAGHWGAVDLAQRVESWIEGSAPEAAIASMHIDLDDERSADIARDAAWERVSAKARAHWSKEVPASQRQAEIVTAQQERWAHENARRLQRDEADFRDAAVITLVRELVEEEVKEATRAAATEVASRGSSTCGLVHELLLDAVLAATAATAALTKKGSSGGKKGDAKSEVIATRKRLRRRKGVTAALSEMLRQRDAADARERAGREVWRDRCLEAAHPAPLAGAPGEGGANGGAARAVPPPFMAVQLSPPLRVSLPLRAAAIPLGTTLVAQKEAASALKAAAAEREAEEAKTKKRGLFDGILALGGGTAKADDESDEESSDDADASSDSDGADAEDESIDLVVALGAVAANPPRTAVIDAERSYWGAINFVPLAPLAHPRLDVDRLVASAMLSAKERRLEREARAAAAAAGDYGAATGCGTIVEQFLHGRVASVATSPCGRLLALGGANGAVAVVDVSWCASFAVAAEGSASSSSTRPPPLPLLVVSPQELAEWTERVENEIGAAKRKSKLFGALAGGGLGGGGGKEKTTEKEEEDLPDRTIVAMRWSMDSGRLICAGADGHIDVWGLGGDAAAYGASLDHSAEGDAGVEAGRAKRRAHLATDAFALLPETDEEEEMKVEIDEMGFFEKEALKRSKAQAAKAKKKEAKAREKARKKRKKERKERKAQRAKEKLARGKKVEKKGKESSSSSSSKEGKAEQGPTHLNNAEEVEKRKQRREERRKRREERLRKKKRAPAAALETTSGDDDDGAAAAEAEEQALAPDGTWEARASIGLLQRTPPQSACLLLSVGGGESEPLLVAEHDAGDSDEEARVARRKKREEKKVKEAKDAMKKKQKQQHKAERSETAVAKRKREEADANPVAICVHAVAFHPSMTLSCAQESLVVGLRSGRIVKLNRNPAVPRLYGPILVSQGGAAMESSFASHARATAGGKSAKVKAMSEHFHAHKAPLLLLDFVARSSLVTVSIDEGTPRTAVGDTATAAAAAAAVASRRKKKKKSSVPPRAHTTAYGGFATLFLWKYAASELCGFSWFVPALRVRLSLAVATLTLDRSVSEKVCFGSGAPSMNATSKQSYARALDARLASGALHLWFVENDGACVYGPLNLADGGHGVGADGKTSVRFDVVTKAKGGEHALTRHSVRHYTPKRRFGRILRAKLTTSGREIVLMAVYPSAPPVHKRAFVRFSIVVLVSMKDRRSATHGAAGAGHSNAARLSAGSQLFDEICCAEHGLPHTAVVSPFVRPWPIDLPLSAPLTKAVDVALAPVTEGEPTSLSRLRELVPADFDISPVLDATGSDYIYVRGFPTLKKAKAVKEGAGREVDLDDVMVYSLLTGQRLATSTLRAAAEAARALPGVGIAAGGDAARARSSAGSGAAASRTRAGAAAYPRGLALARHDLLVTSRGGPASAVTICRIVDSNNEETRLATRRELVEHCGGLHTVRRELRLHTAPPESWVRSSNAQWDVAEKHVWLALRDVVIECVDALFPLAEQRLEQRNIAADEASVRAAEIEAAAQAKAEAEASALALARVEAKAMALAAARGEAKKKKSKVKRKKKKGEVKTKDKVKGKAEKQQQPALVAAQKEPSTQAPLEEALEASEASKEPEVENLAPPSIAAVSASTSAPTPMPTQTPTAKPKSTPSEGGATREEAKAAVPEEVCSVADSDTEDEESDEEDSEAERLLFKGKLVAFYSKHDPSKVEGIDGLVRKYVEKQDKLARALLKKYGESFE